MEEKVEILFKEIVFLNFKKNYLKLKEIGLYPGQELMIEYVIQHEGVTQSELVHLTKRKAATIAKTIQRLIQSGYIIRIEDQHDKRINHLYATDLGKKAYDKMMTFRHEDVLYLKKLFTDEEIEKIYEYLIRIRNEMKGDMSCEESV